MIEVWAIGARFDEGPLLAWLRAGAAALGSVSVIFDISITSAMGSASHSAWRLAGTLVMSSSELSSLASLLRGKGVLVSSVTGTSVGREVLYGVVKT